MAQSSAPLIGAVEMGGTKLLAAVGTDPFSPLRQVRIATEGPVETLAQVNAFFAEAQAALGPLRAVGVGAFGPIRLRRDAPDFGVIGRTAKPGWTGTNVLRRLTKAVDCPIMLDTDVNAAAVAEARWGAGRKAASLIYLTVGTGIGGGLYSHGTTIKGALHPEVGHIRITQHTDDSYRSRCPFHVDCAEGLASGPSIMDRFGCTLEDLPADHRFHAIFADYLAQLSVTLLLAFSPERIVIGGGVMTGARLHQDIERRIRMQLNAYFEPGLPNGTPFIVPPGLGGHAGLAGAFALASDALASGGMPTSGT